MYCDGACTAPCRTCHAAASHATHAAASCCAQVCHIIARANGGANHHDNYYLLGGKFNHKLSRYGDHIMCYVVGQEKAARAVEISQRLGNGTYGKYKGKSAEMLYEEGSRAISRALQDSALERKPRLYR